MVLDRRIDNVKGMDINDIRDKIELFNQQMGLLFDSDADLEGTILNPRRFRKAIKLYESTDDNKLKSDLIYSLGKYVWYNYYRNLHIPKDSEDDLENERIYKGLEQSNLSLYRLIEKHVDWEIEKLNAEAENI